MVHYIEMPVNLRRHIAQRPRHCHAARFLQGFGNAEIRKLIACSAIKNVSWLNVSMNDLPLMKRFQRIANIQSELDNRRFRSSRLGHGKRAKQLHAYENIIARCVCALHNLIVMIVDDMAVTRKFCHQNDLVDDPVPDPSVVFLRAFIC